MGLGGYTHGICDNMNEFSEEVNLSNNETKRITTGIDRLDEIISGGLPSNSITLVSGTPGSGKSILCFHYMWEGLNNGEKCLYLTSDERIESIIRQADELNFDFVETYIYSPRPNTKAAEFKKQVPKKVAEKRYCHLFVKSLFNEKEKKKKALKIYKEELKRWGQKIPNHYLN